jgi:hypothetical protein
MKSLFTIAFIYLCTFGLIAQENKSTNTNKNEVGLHLTDLANGTYQVTYERLLGKHISVGLGVAYKGNNGLIRLSGINTGSIETSDLEYSGLKIIPEVRYYLNSDGNTEMDGFYFGAFVKHSNLKSDLFGKYTNDNNVDFIIDFDAKLNITSVGFMVGYKLPLTHRLAIDFLIAGPGVGFHNYSITNRTDLPQEFYDDLNAALEKYSVFDLIDGKFDLSVEDGETSFTVPAFRYGIALGYSF